MTQQLLIMSVSAGTPAATLTKSRDAMKSFILVGNPFVVDAR